MKRIFFLLSWFVLAASLSAQSDTSRIVRLLENYRIKPSIGLQFWTTYSMGMEVYDASTTTYRSVDDRLNVQLRRSRFGLSGQPYDRLKFNIVTALDLLGHDVLAATQAGTNNGTSPLFRIWNAWLQWQVRPGSDGLYVLTGYFLPVIGRENATPALRSTSFEKAWSQSYLRRQLTGPGSGRATGLLVSGQYHAAGEQFHLTYEAAIQNPTFTALDGNSVGERYSPLVSGRLTFQFGEPESASYSITRRVNYFGARRGFSVSLTAARQGHTDLFHHNSAYGVEWLGNYGPWQLDGEHLWLGRKANGPSGEVDSKGRTGYLRLGYNLSLPADRTLQPIVSYWTFRGPLSGDDLRSATLMQAFTGQDSGLDAGVNYYLNPDTKLSLFYALRTGMAAEDPVTTNNTFFQQSTVGPVRRGSYLGTGLVIFL
ncbi:hypothetical protein [Lewinella sp. IMCC34191]|uniref:hypothetical protein n=1 Tax=Lewinella sp. IMCC34191 TaxID=2259172 RepID=UPI0013008BAD|nr:hypothetical protein [Lewinella sp. IMCC34191]